MIDFGQKKIHMQLYLSDVPALTWFEEHGRNVLILSVFALMALTAILGIFLWRRKRNSRKP